MIFLLASFFSGVFGGCISIAFRLDEIKNSTLHFGKQLLAQIALFLIFLEIFSRYFSYYELSLGSFSISWIWIYLVINNVGYRCTKVCFETFSGIDFFPSNEELEKIIESQNSQFK